MCVILKKEPGKEIPFEHLLASSHRNNDGYGVVVDANGKLIRYGGIKADPEIAAKEVEKILNDAKNELAFVHFRLRTRGSVDEENLQPIRLLSKEDGDDMDMFFLHNGTITDFKSANHSDGPSDSLLFAQQVIEPLVRRSAAFRGNEHVITDPLIPTICRAYGDWSRFALVDSFGRNLIINEESGEKQAYGWASNKASLDPKNFEKRAKIISPSGWPQSFASGNPSIQAKMEKNIFRDQSDLRTPPYQRETISSSTDFVLEDFHYLSEREIEELVESHPKLSALLILDLIEYHYNKTVSA